MLTRLGLSRTAHRPRQGGFTLFELLVTIGIMTILAGIALPALMAARRSAKRTAITNQLQMIYTGLEAFKHEHGGRYPAINVDSTPPLPWTIGDNGAFALCRNLFAPAPAGPDPATKAPNADELVDYKDGPGFRRGYGNGKVYGPYISPDGFRFGYATSDGAGGIKLSDPGTTFAPADYARLVIADGTGKPILYCPPIGIRPRFGTPKAGQPDVYFADSKKLHAGNPRDIVYFDLDQLTGHPDIPDAGVMGEYRGLIRQTGETTDEPFLARARTILGASNQPGQVGKLIGAQPTFTFPVLLWSAGLDGVFGPQGGKNLDDVVLSEQIN